MVTQSNYSHLLREHANVLQPNPADPIAKRFDALSKNKNSTPPKIKTTRKSNIRKPRVGESLVFSRALTSYLDSLINEKRAILELPNNGDDLGAINESISYVKKAIKVLPSCE